MRLPATVPAPAAATAPPAPVGKAVDGVRILLVDDNRDAAELLADSLRTLGHVVRLAYDGPSALAVVTRFRPDVALLDLGLPVMDGIELGERLRLTPALRDLPLIALTGYAQEIDRRRTAAAGFQAHLVKPIDLHALDALVRGRAAAS